MGWSILHDSSLPELVIIFRQGFKAGSLKLLIDSILTLLLFKSYPNMPSSALSFSILTRSPVAVNTRVPAHTQPPVPKASSCPNAYSPSLTL